MMKTGASAESGYTPPPIIEPVDSPVNGKPATACGLGRVWRDTEGGWAGTSTRRGTSSAFDALWTRGSGRVSALLDISIGGNRVLIARGPSGSARDGMSCACGGSIAPDGITVSGTYKCSGGTSAGTGRWQATIGCE